jgi:hypothetical protein
MRRLIAVVTFIALAAATSNPSKGEDVSISSGWNLLGTQYEIDNLDIFNVPGVDIVWGWDNTSKTWKIYTQNEEIMNLAKLYGIDPLNSIQPFSGFWIKASEPTTVFLPSSGECPPPPSTCYYWVPKNYLDVYPEDVPDNFFHFQYNFL